MYNTSGAGNGALGLILPIVCMLNVIARSPSARARPCIHGNDGPRVLLRNGAKLAGRSAREFPRDKDAAAATLARGVERIKDEAIYIYGSKGDT